ncbi:MAG: 30S ribosome-binding factor RbfA [Deltaproteobacteria bacterium]|nr:30S ribosome-binding factor RbfA [Deltaproteobacteria bacterium]MBW2532085.1 30S ribosome-binding factor RbfA [Deltaproteobacteria bacterium]
MVELSAALRKLHDPRLRASGVTRVRLTDDLRLARVFVRLSYGEDEPERRAELMRAIGAAANRLRRHVGQRLALRYTPELRFAYDEGPDAQRRVDELLSEIRAESSEADEDPSDTGEP